MDITQILNLALGIPVFGILAVLIMAKKIVPGWALDDQKDAHENRVSDLRASWDREVVQRDMQITQLRAQHDEAQQELRALRDQTYKDVVPTLARANDGLRNTQELLRDIALRATPQSTGNRGTAGEQ